MKIDSSALIDILAKEKATYSELLELAEQEQQLIIVGDTDKLSDIVKAIELRLLTIQDLEKKREGLLHSTQTPPTLSTFIKDFDKESANKAESLRNDIINLIVRFGEINFTNGELIRRSLSYVDFMLNTLIPSEHLTYGEKPIPNRTSAILFDGRA